MEATTWQIGHTVQFSLLTNSVSPDEQPAAVDFVDIKRKSVRGGLVTCATQALSIAIQLTSTVVLARLLSPDDYGTIAMVMAITAFAGLFRDLGLSTAVIQKGDLSHGQMSNLFWLNVAMGALLTAMLAAASPLVAWFYGKPELVPLTVLLATSFLIGSLATQHGALLVRSMQFGKKAIASIAGSVVTLIISIGLAWYGYGYWALAWGSIVGGLVTTAALFVVSPFRPGLWSRGAGIGSMLRLGANVTAFDFVNYFHRNLDSLLIGRVWGTAELGQYSRAYALLMFPITAIRGPINAVAFPALSRLQNQPDAYRAYYRRVTQVLAFTSMPFTAFLAVAAAPIIELTLGKDWLGVSSIFAFLAVTAFIQPVEGLRGIVLLSSGQGGRYVKLGLFNANCVSCGFLIGVRWGVIGVAISYAIVNYAILYPTLWLTFRDTPLHSNDFFGPIAVPAIASLVAASAIGGIVKIGWLDSLPLLLGVICLAVGFLTAYLGCTLVLPGGRDDLRRIGGAVYRKQFRII